MPLAFERADALGWWLTGAASHGAAQSNPDLSLGKNVSSTPFSSAMVLAANMTPVLGGTTLTILRIAGLNGAGTGVLTAATADSFTWTPPGGTAGAPVTILSAETRLLEGGGSNGPNQFIIVTRTIAGAASGSANCVLSITQHNAISLDRVSSAEAAAGDTEYRCVAVQNLAVGSIDNLKFKVGTIGTQQTTNTTQLSGGGAGTIATSGNFNDWPESGHAVIKNSGGTTTEIICYTSKTSNTLTVPAAGRGRLGTSATAGAATDTINAIGSGLAIGLDPAAVGATPSLVDNTGAGEGTAPSGVVFSTPITDADALSVGTVATGLYKGLWLKRDVILGATANTALQANVDSLFDAA